MATVRNSNIVEKDCAITRVDLHEASSSKDPKAWPLPKSSTDTTDTISLILYTPGHTRPISIQTFSLLLPSNKPFFVSSCGYDYQRDELHLCSDLLPRASPSENPTILISKVSFSRRDDDDAITAVQWNKLRVPGDMALPMSGAFYDLGHSAGTMYCTQNVFGSPNPSGLYYMRRGQPPLAMLTSYYGAPFDTPRGVAVRAEDGSMWFTDAGLRGQPRVYQFEPITGEARVMAGPGGGLVRPWAVAVNRDTVYVVDAGREESEGGQGSPGVVYAFDIVERASFPFLVNQRVFACPPGGTPRGIACSSWGDVFVCSQDGVEVYDEGGSLSGVIVVPGGASSIAFGKNGGSGNNPELFICSGNCLWRVQLRLKE